VTVSFKTRPNARPGGPSWRDRRRAACRRPIDPAEIPYLEALGDEIRRLRDRTGIPRRVLAEAAGSSTWLVMSIEHAIRRTRRSTLERLAWTLVDLNPGIEGGDGSALAERLANLAGPALAPESVFAARMERRRRKRAARKAGTLRPRPRGPHASLRRWA